MDHVGAGGWAYFRVPSEDALSAYARAFSFVEVNSTFYSHPSPRQVEAWRGRVPEDFVFSVKCHQAVTHQEGLAATRPALGAFARSLAVAHRLRAPVLVLETPVTLKFTANRVRDLIAILASADRRGFTFGLEARTHATGTVPPPLARAMQDLAIVDITDLSRQPPRIAADIAYTRLFGNGEHNRWVLSDKQLGDIAAAGKATGADRAFYTFHGVRMYSDAARFLRQQGARDGIPKTAPEQRILDLVSATPTP